MDGDTVSYAIPLANQNSGCLLRSLKGPAPYFIKRELKGTQLLEFNLIHVMFPLMLKVNVNINV